MHKSILLYLTVYSVRKDCMLRYPVKYSLKTNGASTMNGMEGAFKRAKVLAEKPASTIVKWDTAM